MSLAAGVLSAALALPAQGLVAAYDFTRVNYLSWSEDFTNGVWAKNRIDATPNRITITSNPTGFDYVWQAIPSAAQGQTVTAYADMMQGNSAVSDLRILTNNGSTNVRSARIRWSDRTLIPHPDGATIGTVTSEERGGGVLRVTITVTLPALTAGTGMFIYPNGWNSTPTAGIYVDVLRAQWQLGSPSGYEKQTDAQVLVDRSVRLWPAPAGRSNFVNWSEDFTQASWNKAGCTVNAGSTVTTTYNDQAVTLTRYTATNGNQAGNGLTGGGGPGIAVTAGQLVYASVFASPVDSPSTGIVISTGLTQLFVVFNFATQTFTNVAGVPASAQYELLPNGVYRLTVGWIATGTMTVRTHVGYASGLTSVYLGGASISTGLIYEKTTDGGVYDFSLKGRNLLPNSDLSGTAGSPPTGWFSGPVTGISYGADGSVTFTATARYGALSVTSPALPLGGRPFTASVEFTQATPAVYLMLYLYDSAGTDVYRAEFRIEDGRTAAWTPVTFRQPMLELGLTDGGYQASARHGTLGSSTNPDSNDPAWTPQGLVFDGVDDFVAVPGVAGETGETLIFRVPSNTNRAGEVATVYSQGQQSGGPTPYLWVYYVSNAITIQLADGQERVTNSFSVVAPGTLVAITADYASGRIRYYENGALKSAVTHTRPFLPVRSAVARIGCYSISLTHTASGTQSWLSRHTRALTDAEVHQAYRFIRNQLSRRGVTI